MTKYYLIIFVLIIITLKTFACRFEPLPFCGTIEEFPEDIVVSGTITSKNEKSIDLTIIDLFRGEESKEVIRIWDGTDFDCNGIHSMSTKDIGEGGDTIIIMLPKINEIENEWDVLGDYRRPDPYALTPELGVRNGEVTGSVKGWKFDKIPYNEFKENFTKSGDCTSILLSVDNNDSNATIAVTNPFTTNLLIDLDEALNNVSILLYSSNGKLVFKEELHYRTISNIATGMLPTGLYILEIRNENKSFKRKKLIKM